MADAQGVLDCLAAAFEPYRAEYTAEAFQDTVLTMETIRRRLSDMSVLVAVGKDGRVLGTIAYRIVGDEEGHIRGMAVLPALQGSGLAGRLLERAEAELRRFGCSRLSLDTTRPLKRAVAFYERNGFRPTGRVSDFFGMPLYEYVKRLRARRRRSPPPEPGGRTARRDR